MYSQRAWPRLREPVWRFAPGEAEQRSDAVGDVPDAAKDWALESVHLYQQLHFARLDRMRSAPNVTSTGVPLQYRLPRALDAVIVDQLTSRRLRRRIKDRSFTRRCTDAVHLD